MKKDNKHHIIKGSVLAAVVTLPLLFGGVALAEGSLPSTLDLRSADLDGDGVKTAYVTSVKAQSPWGTCWAFGSLSAVESNYILKTGESADTVGFSVRYQAWFAYAEDHGEGMVAVDNAAKRLDFGANRDVSTAVLSSWSGPALESAAPYENNDGTIEKEPDWSLSDSLLRNSDAMADAHVQNVDFLPNTATFNDEEHKDYTYSQEAVNTIKETLMENGAVEVSYYAEASRPGDEPDFTYLNSSEDGTKSQYTYEYKVANHMVSIVGWDDNYSADNFVKGENRPGGDGAWIVKNSWGSYLDKTEEQWKKNKDLVPVSQDGYFYLSYYDMSVNDFTAYEVDADTDGQYAYDNNYQYDYLGFKSPDSRKPSDEGCSGITANVFTTAGTETLKAVSVTTVESDCTADIQVYKVASGTTDPRAGELVAEKNVTLPNGGYHTIDLDEAIDLDAGESFAVVETIRNSQGEGYAPIERGSGAEVSNEDGDEGCTVRYIAGVDVGQSFLYQDGTWVDLATDGTDGVDKAENPLETGNVMIKAFTQNREVNPGEPAENPTEESQPTAAQTSTNVHTGLTAGTSMVLPVIAVILVILAIVLVILYLKKNKKK